MSREKFALGIDFGTESGRVALFSVKDGRLAGLATVPYPHGVLTVSLPGGPKLAPDWALQHPRDYLKVIEDGVAQARKVAKVQGCDVVGIGVDFTSSTPLPVLRDGMPLCLLRSHSKIPHAWPKLWKHHAAQPEANLINAVARQRGEDFLRAYGGRYSSEWFFSKVLEVLHDAPEVYELADKFIEGGDWIVWQLTGQERRSASLAGFKAMWLKGRGFPSSDFFRALHPRLEHVVEEKLARTYYAMGTPADGLSATWASKTGLKPGTPVAVANPDGHVAVPACGATKPGTLVMVMGTSVAHMTLGTEPKSVEGMCGSVEDGIIPGFWTHEAGQSGVGDMLAWFFLHGVPHRWRDEARKAGADFIAVLQRRAASLRPGQAGLMALDWWNGNRSVLVDADLAGVLVGVTLATRADEIYRALLEAAAFGTRTIVEAFEAAGITIGDIVTCGGLPEKNPLLLQIFADVTGREIKLAEHLRTCSALGAAMHGAVAAGKAAGGYDTIYEAARHMARVQKRSYKPRREAHETYDRLFKEYQTLHDYFGRGANDVMKRLKAMQRERRAA